MDLGLTVDFDVDDPSPAGVATAQALANLAVFNVGQVRHEGLDWQILGSEARLAGPYRLVVRHPERRLDLGLKHDLFREIGRLQELSREQLEQVLLEAVDRGLTLHPLRRLPPGANPWTTGP